MISPKLPYGSVLRVVSSFSQPAATPTTITKNANFSVRRIESFPSRGVILQTRWPANSQLKNKFNSGIVDTLHAADPVRQVPPRRAHRARRHGEVFRAV